MASLIVYFSYNFFSSSAAISLQDEVPQYQIKLGNTK